MIIRSKEQPLSAAQQQSRARSSAVQQVANLRTSFAHKRWSQLSPPEREQLLRALAVHLGFIAPD